MRNQNSLNNTFPLLPLDLIVDLSHFETCLFTQSDLRKLFFYFRNKNHIHYLILKFLFSTGISVPELLMCKIHNFDYESTSMFIPERNRLQKRNITLANEFSKELYRYSYEENPDRSLFPGKDGAREKRSVQYILKKASLLLQKEVNVPLIRDAIALYFWDQGFPLREIQTFLGHRSSKSTKQRLILYQNSQKHEFFDDFKCKAA